MFKPSKSVDTVKRIRKKVKINVRQKQMPEDPPHSNEEKVLNVSSTEEIIMNVCDEFERVLNMLNIKSRDEKIYEKLCKIQDLIDSKTSHLQVHVGSVGSPGFQELSLPGSLRSSTQSLYSRTSDLNNDLNFKMFLKQVNCPFCKITQCDKMKLITHLNENCRPLMNRVFAEKDKQKAYSTFQILPNNAIKCNVCMTSMSSKAMQYFSHARSKKHQTNFDFKAKKKSYTNYFFCSCCKVSVPDNYTEFEFHINHEVHKNRSKLVFNKEIYFEKQIPYIYMRSKRFNCLQCNLKFISVKEFLNHLESVNHLDELQKNKIKVCVVFCEFCLEAIKPFFILKHFSSNTHKMAEEKYNEDDFEVCLYCGFTCDKLGELASHMETKCNALKRLRKSINNKNSDGNNSQKIKPTKDKDTEENCVVEEKNYIIIKDNTKLPDLYSYFKEIGEINSIEIYKKHNSIIHFKEKTSVIDVLLLRDVIKINGVKVEITTEKEGEEAEKKEKENNKEVVIKKKSESSDSNEQTENVSVSESGETGSPSTSCDEDDFNEETQNLFQRVSSHLRRNLHKVDSILKEKLLRDARDIFQCQSFSLIGFTGCELSFPLENISFYCDIQELLSDNNHSMNCDTFTFNKGITKVLFKRMINSSPWEDIVCDTAPPIPYISCKHKDTEATCTFTFMRSAKIVSDLLRYYLEKSDVIKSFVLITRFWVNVHELGIRKHEFSLISLIISFLIKEEIVEPNTELNSMPVVFHFLEGLRELNDGVPSPKKKKSSDISPKSLFHRFLLFIYKFDFATNVIYLPSKRPVPKKILNKAPISSLLANLETSESITSTMCVIDPLLHVNLTSGISEKDEEAFLKTVKITISNNEF